MSRRNKDMLIANILYAVGVFGIVGVGVVLGIIIGILQAINGATTALVPHSAAYNVVLVLGTFLPIMLPALLLIALPFGRRFIRPMRLRFAPTALLAIPTAIVGYVFVIGISTVWTGLLQGLGAGQAQGMGAPNNLQQLFVSIFVIALTPALCEEFLLRGIFLPTMERYFKNPISAIALSGMLFGLMHGDASSAPAHIFLGLVMGGLVVATGSLWAGILYHFVNNALAMILSYVFTNVDMGSSIMTAETLPTFTMISVGLLYTAIGGVLLSVMLYLFYRIYQKRRANGYVESYEIAPENAYEIAPDGALPRDGDRNTFLPWLPVVLAAPLIAGLYLTTLATLFLMPFLSKLPGM